MLPNYHKWSAVERGFLFEKIAYTESQPNIFSNSFQKIYTPVESNILTKLKAQKGHLAQSIAKAGGSSICYTRKVGYFLQILDFEPLIKDASNEIRLPTEIKFLLFNDVITAKSALFLLNSTLFYWFFTIFPIVEI